MRWRTISDASGGQEELQAFDVGASGELLALVIHPENAEGERGVDGGLGFVGIDAQARQTPTGPRASSPRVYTGLKECSRSAGC